MGGVADIIKSRRSIRRYEEKPIPEASLQEVLEAVRWAPSWANTQCWEVVVVREPSQREKLMETLNETNPARKAFVQAPIVLVLCGKLKSSGFYKGKVKTKHGDWFMYDLGLATQNLCLAGHELGLGTVIVGLFDHDKAKEILAVPEGYEVVSMIPLGYPAKDAPVPKRREISEFTHQNAF